MNKPKKVTNLSIKLIFLAFLLVKEAATVVIYETYTMENPPSIAYKFGMGFKSLDTFATYKTCKISFHQDNSSPNITLRTINTKDSLLNKILVVEASCDTSKYNLTKSQNYQYRCFNATMRTLKAFNSGQFTETRGNEVFLELPNQVKFSSYKSLENGFLLRTNYTGPFNNRNYVFDYTSWDGTLHGIWTYGKMVDFPRDYILALFALQLVIVIPLLSVQDKRRLPMYTLYIVALSYLPMSEIIKRGYFVEPGSGFDWLYAFYAVSLTIALVGGFCRRARSQQNLWYLGLVLVFLALFLTLQITFFTLESLGLLLLLGPISLIVEKLLRTKHIYRGLDVLVLVLSQGGLYYWIMSGEVFIFSAGLYIRGIKSYFPVGTYCLVAIGAVGACLWGEHIGMNLDWKQDLGSVAKSEMSLDQTIDEDAQASMLESSFLAQSRESVGEMDDELLALEQFDGVPVRNSQDDGSSSEPGVDGGLGEQEGQQTEQATQENLDGVEDGSSLFDFGRSEI